MPECASAQAVGPDILPVTFTNNTGRADAVYLYVIGTQLSSGRLGYVNQACTFTTPGSGRTARRSTCSRSRTR
jgi:hypothetical protein